jgi:hypothetical protein
MLMPQLMPPDTEPGGVPICIGAPTSRRVTPLLLLAPRLLLPLLLPPLLPLPLSGLAASAPVLLSSDEHAAAAAALTEAAKIKTVARMARLPPTIGEAHAEPFCVSFPQAALDRNPRDE